MRKDKAVCAQIKPHPMSVANVPFKTITGGIFEVGFPDVIQQMWAAFMMEREGALGSRFGCATPAEAVQSHRIFAAALASQTRGETVSPSWKHA